MILKLGIPRAGRPPVILYLPLFIIWIVLLPFAFLFIFLMLMAAAFTWPTGYGRFILLTIPMIGALLWNLEGLQIDIQGEETKIYLSFI